MDVSALDIAAVAAELGRGEDWLYRHWRALVAKGRLPRPIQGQDGGALRWNRAQVYAYLDRDLPPAMKPAAAAYRAAAAAAAAEVRRPAADRDAEVTIADHRAALDARFAKGAS